MWDRGMFARKDEDMERARTTSLYIPGRGAMITRSLRCAVVLMAAIMLLPLAAQAQEETHKALDADEIKSIDKQTRTIDAALGSMYEALDRLRGTYVKPLTKTGGVEYAQKRFEQAHSLFTVKDYQHAAIMLLDLLDNDYVKNDGDLKYKVLYYLGESLYQRKNFILARKYMDTVVAAGEDRQFYQDAAMRLVEVAINVNDINAARRYFKMLHAGHTETGFMIRYAYGKYLFNIGKLDEAESVFKEIPLSSGYGLRALYFLGAITVEMASQISKDDAEAREAALLKAQQIFEQLMDAPAIDADADRLVQQLAQINVGRLLYERSLMNGDSDNGDAEKDDEKIEDMVTRALSLYRRVPPTSPYYDEAYYELVWIYIRRSQFRDALNALEIMLGTMPDSLYTPEGQLTKADLLSRLRQFKNAERQFENVVKVWQGVVDMLDELMNVTRGRTAAEIHGTVMEKVRQLPLVALKWLKQESQVSKALDLEKEIDMLKEQLAETKKILEKLQYASKQKNKSNIFPVLNAGREEGLNLANATVGHEKNLVQISNNLVGGRLDKETREQYVQAQAQRRKLEEKYRALPKTAQQRYAVKESKLKRIENLTKLQYRLQVQLKGLNGKIDELIERKENLRMNPLTRRDFIERVGRQLRAEKEQMEDMLTSLETVATDIEREVQGIKLGKGQREEESTRRAYETALARERAILKKVRAKMTPQELQLFNRIEDARRRATRLGSKVQGYLKDLEVLGATWLREFDRDIEKEQQSYTEWNAELARLELEAGNMASEVVVANLKNVRKHFYDIVLDADVGLVEITYEQWDMTYNELEKTKSEQRSKLKDMEQTFEEPLDMLNQEEGAL